MGSVGKANLRHMSRRSNTNSGIRTLQRSGNNGRLNQRALQDLREIQFLRMEGQPPVLRRRTGWPGPPNLILITENAAAKIKHQGRPAAAECLDLSL
ncbi:unknown [Sutterella wadsworthensis CAG:135]|nr:unknown [Sutterella wadsworthensis CAG:135]